MQESLIRRYLPMVEAYDAGLQFFSVLRREVIAVPRPEIHVVDGRLHCPDGPAVRYANGARYYFWHDVPVPEHVIMRPESLTAQEILGEQNVEVRRSMIERIGLQRFLTLLGHPEPVQEDSAGALYRVRLTRDEAWPEEDLVILRVVDPSTGRTYFLRVPPTVQTAREAVAWTYGMNPDEWNPILET